MRDAIVDWIILLLAGLFEIAWAVGLKYSEGFTRFWPSIGTSVALVASMALLALAMRTLPVGTAYSVWVGIGAVGTVIFGIVLWNEPVNLIRMLSVAFIVVGVIGLKFATPN
jgi:quaternary ammonium compound-resistance protein SugE